jgi:hypothetical protein
MISKPILFLTIGVIIGAIAIGSYAYNNEVSVEAERTDTEIFTVVKNNLNTLGVATQDDIKKIGLSLAKEVDLLTETDDEFADKLLQLELTMELMTKEIKSIKNQLLISQSSGSTSTQSGDFDLILLGIDGGEVIDGIYDTDDTIYIRGQYDGDGGTLKWSVKEGSKTLQSGSGSIPSNGTFLFVWNTLGSEDKGKYKGIVVINGKTDSINFELQ